MGGNAKAANVAIGGEPKPAGKKPCGEVDMISPGNQRIDRGATVTQHTACRTNDKTPHVTQACNQRISQSDAELLVASVLSRRAENSKRQHCDRFLVATQLACKRRQRSETMVELT